LGEGFGADAALFVHFGVERARHIFRVEEELASRGLSEYVSGWGVYDLHDHGELLGLVFTGKDGIAREQLNEYAAERPLFSFVNKVKFNLIYNSNMIICRK
jgi:hypothetical protein